MSEDVQSMMAGFFGSGVEVPMRELLSRLRLWREAALRVEFEIDGDLMAREEARRLEPASFAGSEKK